MKTEENSILTILISFLIVLLLSFIPKINHIDHISSESVINKNLNSITKSLGGDFTLIKKNNLSNDIINIVYENLDTLDYRSYFIDKTTGDLLSYRSIFKHNKLNDFYNKEKELLSEKYPKFIVDGIYNSSVNREVYINNNSLVIQYYNVDTNPKYNDKITLIINYNEIDKYLNYDHNLDSEYKNESGYDYDPTKKYIAFSFDDGPSRNNTTDIINYLNNNKMKATFFMVGYLMENNPDIVKYVYDNHMEIGSHTWSHKNLRKQKIKAIETDLQKTDAVYNSITNNTFDLLRPPYGALNDKVRDTFSYSYILWSVDTLDWKYKDSDRLYDYIINNVEDGDIVLMHDIHNTTKIGVERILPELYVRGYRVVTVSELAKIKNIELQKNTAYRSFK